MTRLKDGHIGKRYKQNEFDHYEIGMERLNLRICYLKIHVILQRILLIIMLI